MSIPGSIVATPSRSRFSKTRTKNRTATEGAATKNRAMMNRDREGAATNASLTMRCRHLARGFGPFTYRDAEFRALATAKNNDRQFPGDGASQGGLDIIRIGDGLTADRSEERRV